ncbi:MAG: tRNA lysidine(34) synthetase TilS, partial [Spirochaetota bacterium]|nr:tRNA lysidine(34) synthetase TilS [Spirochaetota bacterium]
MIRGEESDEDETFMIKVADEKGLDIFIRKFDFSNKTQKASFEEFARYKRYEIANEICNKSGYNLIATAHNKNDNIETIIMRVFQGTGLHGLCGIRNKRDNIIRPILFLSSEEIYSHLKENKIFWREDSSNSENRYLRNYTRNSLLPMIYDRYSGADKAILSIANASEEGESLINDLLFEKFGNLYEVKEESIYIELDRYIDDKRVFKYVISKAIREIVGVTVQRGMLEEVYRRVKVKKSHLYLYENRNLLVKKSTINKKQFIVIYHKKEFIKREIYHWEYNIDLSDGKEKRLYLKEIGKTININIVEFPFFKYNFNKEGNVFIALNENNNYIIFRNRRNGDRIRLEFGTKKIKEILIEEKLDNIAKNSIPILDIDSEVAAFLPQFTIDLPNRVSIDFWVKPNSKKILAIQMWD